MNGKAVLDSNAVVQILNGKLDLPRLGFDEILVPMTVVGELFFGVHKSARVEENRRRLLTFLELISIVGSDIAIAEAYGEIKARLRSKGKPIPENDIWIAAISFGIVCHLLPMTSTFKMWKDLP